MQGRRDLFGTGNAMSGFGSGAFSVIGGTRPPRSEFAHIDCARLGMGRLGNPFEIEFGLEGEFFQFSRQLTNEHLGPSAQFVAAQGRVIRLQQFRDS
jgi:hypothetical protein